MLSIVADAMMTATRQKSWNAPAHWVEPDAAVTPTREHRNNRRHELRRWLRETGIM